MPKVSVIMGVYNGGHRLTKAVDSIMNQTYDNFEFIICDDASDDNSYLTLKKLRESNDRIILIKNEKNMGLAAALNNCLEIAKGEYIARMDDDDDSHPTRFEKQVDFLDKYDDYAIVGSSVNMCDDGGVWGKLIYSGERSSLDIYKRKTFFHPTVMIRKQPLLSVNGYTVDQYTKRTEDFDLWVKMYHAGYKGYNTEEVLLDYYEGQSSYKKRRYNYRIDEYKIRKKARGLLNIPFRYSIFELKPLIVGLIPDKFMKLYRLKKFGKIRGKI